MLVEYDQHGKIKGGDPERMVDDSAAAYVALTVDGTDTLLMAGHALRRGTVPPAPGPAWPAPATGLRSAPT